MRSSEFMQRVPAAVRLRVEGADALAVQGGGLSLISSLGDFTLPLLTVEGTISRSQPFSTLITDGLK